VAVRIDFEPNLFRNSPTISTEAKHQKVDCEIHEFKVNQVTTTPLDSLTG